MSDESRQNERNFPPRMRPRDDANGQRKGPKFNIYWVWAIIFAVLVGFQLFGSLTPDTKSTSSNEFFQMLKKGDVDKLTTVTNKNLVRVYLKKESIEKYKSQLSKNSQASIEKGPQFEIQSVQS